MTEKRFSDTGLAFLVGIVARLLKIVFAIAAFPFRVWWHDANPLNVTRIRMEKGRGK